MSAHELYETGQNMFCLTLANLTFISIIYVAVQFLPYREHKLVSFIKTNRSGKSQDEPMHAF